MLSTAALLERLTLLPLFILSLSVHEWAHAFSAWKLGDDTARSEGRLTLNPLVHIDLLGTIVLPLLGVPFGWAKPVPVNPARFRRDVSMGGGMALTASAGPLSNLVLALLAAITIGILYRFAPALTASGSPWIPMLGELLFLNVALAVFNLLPVPPLDGSRIVAWLLPTRLRDGWHQLEQFAPLLLGAVFLFGGRLVSAPIDAISRYLVGLISLIA